MKTARVVSIFLTKDREHGRIRSRLLILPSAILLLLSAPRSSYAGSATWQLSPATGDWNTASNWSPATVPNGSGEIATFATSNQTNVSISANTEVNRIVFPPGADAFTINLLPVGHRGDHGDILTLSGSGISNNSGRDQHFVMSGDVPSGVPTMVFSGVATAGDQTIFTVNFSEVQFLNSANAGSATFRCDTNVVVNFLDDSSAGNANITCNALTDLFSSVDFFGNATAGDSTITLNPSPPGRIFSRGAGLGFEQSSTGGHATIVAHGAEPGFGGAAFIRFLEGSTADHAFVTATGGTNGGDGSEITFSRGSYGGSARVAVFGNARLDVRDFTLRTARGFLTVGSIEGDGFIFLAATTLTTGSNDLNTTFAGVIQDQPPGFTGKTGGSLQKIGKGKLVLQDRNTYTGGTTVVNGKLIVNNVGASGTGTGPVRVTGGKLGGKGIIAGAVTVGTGSGAGAVLAPGYLHGAGRPGALTIQSPLTFESDGVDQMEVDSSNGAADEVIANGVTINAGAQFSFIDIRSAALPPGTLFNAIQNTSVNPIAGTFANLPDGSTFTSNGNKYQANYEGGDGNDLTLAVIP